MPTDRPLLIFDLDETLIHGSNLPLSVPHHFRVGHYHIHERPGVRDFAAACARLYDLAVWTSATLDYATEICDVIMAAHPLVFLWARDRCTRRFDPETHEDSWIKDLRKVKRAGHDLRRVLVVEDSPRNIQRHYGNVVAVRAFTGDPEDRELPALAAYLATLAGVADVRTVEKRGWRNAS